MAFDLESLVRPNILKLAPYRCARDDYNGPGYIFLDANENSYGPSLGDYQDLQQLNRYPDPNQTEVKRRLCKLRGGELTPEHLFAGVGSDEAIDNILRVFCRPGQDKILTTPPTYGMYAVCANINDVGVVKVPLDAENGFQPQMETIMETLEQDASIKCLFLCSPGNPTSKLVDPKHILRVLESGWHGILVVDEAYIDFSLEGSSVCTWVTRYPNLIVMQTLSKAFGLAAIRLGVAFCAAPVAALMNALKAPYNISTPTSDLALRALSDDGLETMRRHVAQLNASRTHLAQALEGLPQVKKLVGGTEANFIMAQIQSTTTGAISNKLALQVYEHLAKSRKVVVRFRGNESGCEGCLRITVGTEQENATLLEVLTKALTEFDV